MANPLSKFEQLDDVQLNGMIAHTQRVYPYLEITSPEGVFALCRLMIETPFLLETKPTPIRASFLFLRKVSETMTARMPGVTLFRERDFVFAIKMFGLKVRAKNGVNQFVPDNELNEAEDEEVSVHDSRSAKELDVYVSDVHKRTKIQRHAIESAANRLLRDFREMELGRVFSDLMSRQGMSIGQAREYLRDECKIKDHEFVRIRKHAIDLGLFSSKRNQSKNNRRVTLDDDVVPYVEELQITLGSKNRGQLTPSQAVNQALRDFHKLTTGAALPKAMDKTNGKVAAKATGKGRSGGKRAAAAS